jgi:chromosome segregation ATPase
MLAFLAKGGWVLVVLAVVAGWVVREIKAAERRGELRARAERVAHERDSLLGAVRDSLEAEIAAAQAHAESLAAVRAGLRAEMAGLRAAAVRERSRADSILMALPDSEAAPIVAVLDTLEREVAVCSDALGTCEEEVEAVQGQLEAMGRRALNAENLAERQGVLLEDLQAERAGGFDVLHLVLGVAAVLGWLAAFFL